jgi:hypothetical protein
MRFYFDGSEGKDDGIDNWLTLAGFVACDAFWDDFDKKWKTMLLERYPIAPFVHMWQMISGVDPFERVADGRIKSLISLFLIPSTCFRDWTKKNFVHSSALSILRHGHDSWRPGL